MDLDKDDEKPTEAGSCAKVDSLDTTVAGPESAAGAPKGASSTTDEDDDDEAVIAYDPAFRRTLTLPTRCSACGEIPEEKGALQLCPGATEQALCVRCRFRAMDPFRLVLESEHILHMATITESSSSFTLDLPDLKEWRKAGHEVEVRSLRRLQLPGMEKPRHPLHQAWPKFLSMEINGKDVLTVKAPLRGRKRRDVPLSISMNLRRGSNEFELTVEDEKLSEYVVAVVRVAPRKPRDMAKHVLRTDADECLERVRELLAARPQADAAGKGTSGGGVECVGDERLQLKCPITLMWPASAPVRGELCRHLQCLDLDAFLVANFRMKAFNSRWRCPVCNLELRPQDVCIDMYVQGLLDATPYATDELFVAPSGDWCIANSSSKVWHKPGEIPAPPGENGTAGEKDAGTEKPGVTSCIVEDGDDEGEVPSKAARSGVVKDHRKRRKRRGDKPEAADSAKKKRQKDGKEKKPHREGKSRHTAEGKQRQAVKRAPAPGGTGRSSATKSRLPAPAPRIPVPVVKRASRGAVAPKHAIDLESDAPPEMVSDSGGSDAPVVACADKEDKTKNDQPKSDLLDSEVVLPVASCPKPPPKKPKPLGMAAADFAGSDDADD